MAASVICIVLLVVFSEFSPYIAEITADPYTWDEKENFKFGVAEANVEVRFVCLDFEQVQIRSPSNL